MHDDGPAELVREFLSHCHGVPRDQRVRVTQADRDAAGEWLKTYGLEKGKWMVERCEKMRRGRGGERIMVFRGLGLYENAAAGAYERQRRSEDVDREQHRADEMRALWVLYQRNLVERFDATATAEQLALLEAETRDRLRREMPDRPAFIIDAGLLHRLCDEKCARMNRMDETEFRAYPSEAALREALVARHGVELLGAGAGQVTPEAA